MIRITVKTTALPVHGATRDSVTGAYVLMTYRQYRWTLDLSLRTRFTRAKLTKTGTKPRKDAWIA